MSSTTSASRSRDGQRGQVLVLFAGGILTLLVVAALAYDVGMMLVERRDGQNAADAAALAGARYIFEPDCVAPAWTCTKARAAAVDVALANGYDDADPTETVEVHIPAVNGRYQDLPSFIEVDIDSERASIFGAVIGRATWPVGVFAVATNDNDLNFPFSMMALNQTMCNAIQVTGSGVVQAFGNIQSNSNGTDCAGPPVGFLRSGTSTVEVFADDATCRSVGELENGNNGVMTCTEVENSFALPDPLRNLEAPAMPALPTPAMVRIGGPVRPIQAGCPGATVAPTLTQTAGCDVGGNGGSSSAARGTHWVLSPGLYPAGLTIDNQVRVYLLPGIYWIGGGGLKVDGDSSLVSVSSADEAASMNANFTVANVKSLWTSGGGGVLLYNSKLPTTSGGPIDIGGGGGFLLVKAFFDPISDPPDPNEKYNNMSIFQDRTVASPAVMNGSTAAGEVSGIVYLPAAHLQLNGSTTDFVVDQIIADSFKVNGSTATIKIMRRTSVDAVIIAAGLVD